MLSYLVYVVTTVLYIVAISDVVRSNRTLGEKLVLTFFIIVFPVLGPTVYLFVLRGRK
jgi:hypothetical protein